MGHETISADRIEPPHGVQGRAKLASIVESMRRDGYAGEPILVVGDNAWTGSHRIAAARIVGVEVDIYRWEPTQEQMDAIDDECARDRYGRPSDQDQMIKILRGLPGMDAEALRLYEAECAKD